MSGVLNLLLSGAAAAIKDAYFNLTTLLLPGDGTNGAQNNTFLDSSSNNFTITRNGNTTQGTFSPFSQTGWSNFFDASRLAAPYSTATDISTGDFTIEFWVNAPQQTSGSGVRAVAFYNGSPSLTSDIGWNFVFQTNGAIRFEFCSGSSNVVTITSATTALNNQFNHVAVTRSGSAFTLWLNGVSQGTGSSSANGNTNTGWSTFVGSITANNTDNVNRAYLSNFRIIKGQALFSGTFTPATSALTPAAVGATGSGAAISITGTTALLLCQDNRFRDASVNNFTLTTNGFPSVQAFSPFAPTAAYSAATNGGSGYFDGSGDYLTLASNANLAPSSSTYTFECWVYRTASGAMTIWDTSTTNGFYVHINSSNKIVLRAYGTADIITSSANAPVNAWFHVAVARGAANSTKMWINGSSSDGGSATDSTTYAAATTYIGIYDGSSVTLTGYISDMRLVKGSDVYGVSNSTITIPTAPLTAITNTQFLANFTNGGIIDATAKNDLETVGNAQISTTQSKWGGSSLYFDGTGDNVYATALTINDLSSGDWTIEGWVNVASFAATGHFIFWQGNTSSYAGIRLGIDTNQQLFFLMSQNGSSWAVNSGAIGSTMSTSTWYHIAITRSGTSVKVFLNGTQAGTTYTVTGALYAGSLNYVGAINSSGVSQSLNGYIDDLRITRGYARYTAAFTPPSAAFALQ